MIYNTVWIGDVVEQSIRMSNLEQFKKNIEQDKKKIDEYERIKDALEKEQMDIDFMNGERSSCKSHMGEDGAESSRSKEECKGNEFKRSFNCEYKFMSIDQLEIFKQQYFRSVNQLIMRMYKSVFAIYTLFPEFNDFSELSIFDKAYQLDLINHCFSQYIINDLTEVEKLKMPKLYEFEIEAQTLF